MGFHWAPRSLIAHEADIGARGDGATLAEAFENAARAMTATLVDPAGVRSFEGVSIECAAPDAELLLVDWLNALVIEMATRGLSGHSRDGEGAVSL